MANFTESERKFLQNKTLIRVATITKEGKPHITPASAAFDGNNFYFAIDYGSKKDQNLKNNKNIAIVIDSFPPARGIMIQGTAGYIEKGKEFSETFALLQQQVIYYQKHPFGEGESPIIKVIDENKVSWGIK